MKVHDVSTSAGQRWSRLRPAAERSRSAVHLGFQCGGVQGTMGSALQPRLEWGGRTQTVANHLVAEGVELDTKPQVGEASLDAPI